ncbi:MAG: carboxypeptidase regulatory-like domain-containing protein, partial [Dokdonella sp.]
MNIEWLVAIALGLAAALGFVRTLRDRSRLRVVRIALQLVVAGLLYVLLFPPLSQEPFSADELTVLTPGVTAAQINAIGVAATIVALPGVDAALGIERAPDLGTALRRHPQSRQLHIVGGGL